MFQGQLHCRAWKRCKASLRVRAKIGHELVMMERSPGVIEAHFVLVCDVSSTFILHLQLNHARHLYSHDARLKNGVYHFARPAGCIWKHLRCDKRNLRVRQAVYQFQGQLHGRDLKLFK